MVSDKEKTYGIEKLSNEKNNKLLSYPFLVLIVCIEAVFLDSSLSNITGPLILILLLYLYFWKRETIFVTTVIVLANDALGTIIFNSISFQYLLIPIVAYEFIVKCKYSVTVKGLIVIVVALIMSVQPLITGVIKAKAFFISFLYILAFTAQYDSHRDDRENFIEKFMESTAIIVALIALHACITGGVRFYGTASSTEYLRRGILGVGIGDSNFSCLLLCTGIACTLNSRKFFWLVKCVFIGAMFGAMFATLSTTGLLAVLITGILSLIINKKIRKGIRRLLIVVLALVALYQLYFSLPASFHIQDVDAYIVRMETKFTAFIIGDYNSATTGRTYIAEQYWNYINNDQGTLAMLFGGNSLTVYSHVPHNTYLDFLLQFGYVGTIAILSCVIISLWHTYRNPVKAGYRKCALILKTIYLFFALTLSIFEGQAFAMMFFVMFVL